MRISKPRRELYKQQIKSLLMVEPRIDNLTIADRTGLHRNTVSRMLNEIRLENEKATRERWKFLLNDVTEIAQIRNEELNHLWADSYWTASRSNPAALVAINRANWSMLKDLYRIHLEYLGLGGNPKSLVQINITGNGASGHAGGIV